MPLEAKVKFHNVVPLNFPLWGSENWSGNAMGVSKREVFCRKATRIAHKKTNVEGEGRKNKE